MYGVLETLALYGDELGTEGRQDLRIRAERHFRLCMHAVEQPDTAGRIERGELRVDRRPLDLAETLPDLVADCRLLVHPDPVGLRVPDAPLGVCADEAVLLEILFSLFKNVRDHAGHGPVLVSAAEHDGRVVIHVDDTGRGFPTAPRAELLERGFKRAGSPGLGLGLFVSRHLAEALGGGIELSDADHTTGGARVTISLPTA